MALDERRRAQRERAAELSAAVEGGRRIAALTGLEAPPEIGGLLLLLRAIDVVATVPREVAAQLARPRLAPEDRQVLGRLDEARQHLLRERDELGARLDLDRLPDDPDELDAAGARRRRRAGRRSARRTQGAAAGQRGGPAKHGRVPTSGNAAGPRGAGGPPPPRASSRPGPTSPACSRASGGLGTPTDARLAVETLRDEVGHLFPDQAPAGRAARRFVLSGGERWQAAVGRLDPAARAKLRDLLRKHDAATPLTRLAALAEDAAETASALDRLSAELAGRGVREDVPVRDLPVRLAAWRDWHAARRALDGDREVEALIPVLFRGHRSDPERIAALAGLARALLSRSLSGEARSALLEPRPDAVARFRREVADLAAVLAEVTEAEAVLRRLGDVDEREFLDGETFATIGQTGSGRGSTRPSLGLTASPLGRASRSRARSCGSSVRAACSRWRPGTRCLTTG